MKPLLLLLVPAAAAVLPSCTTTGATYGAPVEEVSRYSNPAPLPYTGEDTYVPAAIDYSRGRVPEQTINVRHIDDRGYGGYRRGYRY